MKHKIRLWAFLLSFVLCFGLFDYALSLWGENCCPWTSNDYEVTRAAHPEKVWDKVFFGNSTVIAGYREDISTAGYINLGMDYAVVSDLWDLLRQGHLQLGSELVVGLNLFTLYDEFDTNPSYLWHRKAPEPYAYFHRDKLLLMMKNQSKALLGMEAPQQDSWKKILYYGSLSDGDLADKIALYNEKYYCLPADDFQNNIEALEKIAHWCDENEVRLRLLWMPSNPSVKQPSLADDLMAQVNDWCAQRNIQTLDMTAALDETCFYDVGHLNYEYGAYEFTKEVDTWLKS